MIGAGARLGGTLRGLGLGIVLAAVLGAGPSLGPAFGAEAAPDFAAARVVVVGAPGLLWGDVASGLAPELTELAAESALGDMTVRAARSRTCVLDGWASLGAGNRARYPAPTADAEANLPQLDPAEQARLMDTLAGCGQQEQVALYGLTDVVQTVGRIAEDEGTRRFGAQPGALGEAVGCSTAIGRASAIAVSAPGAQVSINDEIPASEQLVAALGRCPLSLISVPELIGSVPTVDSTVGPPGQAGEAAVPLPGRPRGQAVAALDDTIAEVRAAIAGLPGDTLLLVAGLSEKGISRPQLHPLIAWHPDVAPGYLTSSSTGRTPYVQLIDVAPTALRALDIDVPESMSGSPIRWAEPTAGIGAALAELRDLNRAAVAHLGLTRTFFWTLVALAGALVVGVAFISRRGVNEHYAGRPWSLSQARILSGAALSLAALPAATLLANLVPWWRAAQRELALALAVLACTLALVGLARVLGDRRGPLAKALPIQLRWAGPPVAVLVATALTIGADVVAGSPMELNALLGYNAIVAGRFVGLGNLCFGLFAVSSLLATAVLVRGSTRQQLAGIGAVGVLAVVLVGAAGLGRDFGGVLALVPAFAVLGLLATGTRLSPRRFLAIGAITAAAVSAFALVDYQRAPDDRTHLGRFVAQLIDGQAWTVVARKAAANIDVLTGSPLTWLIPIFAVAAWLLLRSEWSSLRHLLAARPPWRSGLVAAGVAVAIGALINDSGIAVPAVAGCVVVPVLIWLTQRWRPGGGSPAAPRIDTPLADADSPAVAC